MKNRVVYFGDSFISDKARPGKLQFLFDKAWPVRLAKKLGMTPLNLGRDGVGLDWIVSTFTYMAIDGGLDTDDLIVIGTSSWDRKWMVRDHPGASHLLNLSYPTFRTSIAGDCDPKDRPAIMKQMEIASDYYIHGWNQSLTYIEQIAHLNHIRAIAKDFKLNVLILPTFQHNVIDKALQAYINYNTNYQVSGFLNQSSLCEFAGSDDDMRYANRQNHFQKKWDTGFDVRPNHLSVENHHILTDKLYDTITNNTTLNLAEGFIEDIYN